MNAVKETTEIGIPLKNYSFSLLPSQAIPSVNYPSASFQNGPRPVGAPGDSLILLTCHWVFVGFSLKKTLRIFQVNRYGPVSFSVSAASYSEFSWATACSPSRGPRRI